jgi:hypothetical protein
MQIKKLCMSLKKFWQPNHENVQIVGAMDIHLIDMRTKNLVKFATKPER